ncbi:MAG TPA: hypothetical protein VEI50_07685 [Nitrospiraceae bacterium]|nr:hypothetical protein [Nitrospiraceae bacterium]
MNSNKALTLVHGFMVILGIYAGYWLGASRAQTVYENMKFLLNSDRNLEIVQNIKALEGLRENRMEETIQFMHVRLESALKYDGIQQATLARAREYQRKYCKTLCLGLQ